MKIDLVKLCFIFLGSISLMTVDSIMGENFAMGFQAILGGLLGHFIYEEIFTKDTKSEGEDE